MPSFHINIKNIYKVELKLKDRSLIMNSIYIRDIIILNLFKEYILILTNIEIFSFISIIFKN